MNEPSPLFEPIIAAYKAAIGDRDPAEVNAPDLLPAIFKAVPTAEVEDIVAALRWQAEKDKRRAAALRAYHANRVRKRGANDNNSCGLCEGPQISAS